MYQVLYRKYRPKNFMNMIGQKTIVKILTNSIMQKKINHAYLFFGSRGTGKTTTAKILARAVNCENPIDGNPCENCNSCKLSSNRECVDIIEIDAASNNGVDEIRDLKSKINLVPSELKYKVYIIDEVHMLSIGAFNALLKTIEEPPEHSIFILATTEFGKVPETIISRCQSFSFKRISVKEICERLKYICEEENVEIEEKVLEEIAKYANGGMRDSIGLLDKLIAYCDKKIMLKDFYEINSLLNEEELESFIKTIIDNDIEKSIEFLNKIYVEGKNIIEIAKQLLFKLSQTIIKYYTEKEPTDCDIEQLKHFAVIVNENMFSLKESSNPKIFFEIILLENMPVKTETKEITKKEPEIKQKVIQNLEKRKENNTSSMSKEKKYSNSIEISNNIIIKNNEIKVNNTFCNATKENLDKCKRNLDKLKDYTFDQKKGYLVCDLLDGHIRTASSDYFILSYEYESMVKTRLEEIEKLEQIYTDITKDIKKIAVVSDEKWEKLKQEYINNKKNGIMYEYIKELNTEKQEKRKEVPNETSNTLEMFGDLVEFK